MSRSLLTAHGRSRCAVRASSPGHALTPFARQYRHPESGFGHDKSKATAPYRDLPHRPTILFCGDGVSDLSAAKAADLLFVKVVPGHTNDLAVHCDREKIPYVAFEHFEQVKEVVARLVEGKSTIQEELARE